MLTIGLPGFLAFAFYFVVFGLIWRVVAGLNSGNVLGKAMAAIH
jgi:hypothetical protein